jgi:hypothetical protein
MTRTTPEQNKALVLEAFDTLFNKRDYAAAERFWSAAIFSTAPTLRLVVTACSILSALFRKNSATKTTSSSPRAIM